MLWGFPRSWNHREGKNGDKIAMSCLIKVGVYGDFNSFFPLRGKLSRICTGRTKLRIFWSEKILDTQISHAGQTQKMTTESVARDLSQGILLLWKRFLCIMKLGNNIAILRRYIYNEKWQTTQGTSRSQSEAPKPDSCQGNPFITLFENEYFFSKSLVSCGAKSDNLVRSADWLIIARGYH